MKLDFSPVVANVQLGAIKNVIVLLVSTLAYAVVFLLTKQRLGKRLAHLAAQFAGGRGAIAAMYVEFSVLTR
ncbi:hypothetical protein PQR75_45415 [Paraburkholderia fungorum]|uniref:hypothetical protein n=1 Tax=Paraburkholderia fungorum TaxID=134537 RepID=UPI0038BBF374